jgi:hypothetical protein
MDRTNAYLDRTNYKKYTERRIRMILCNESKMILQFIKEVGGITTEQINAFFPNADTRAKEYYLNALKGTYIKETSRGSGIYVSISDNTPFLKKNEMAGWVLLKNEVDMNPDTKEYFRAAHPAQIYFISNGKVYTVIYIDENGAPLIKAMNEQYFSHNVQTDDNSEFIFVTTSEAARDIVLNTNIKAPFLGAFISRDNNGQVNIEYDIFED